MNQVDAHMGPQGDSAGAVNNNNGCGQGELQLPEFILEGKCIRKT